MQYKNTLLVFFACVIILYMSIEVWGLMPKSQDNPQTIEERVAEMIAQHEHDPESHMGEGESIDVHRKNEIIDHPQSSLVPDKLSQTQNVFTTLFESVASWISSGVWGNGLMNLSVLMRGNVAGDRYMFNENFEFRTNQTDDSPLDNYWQTRFRYYENYHVADFAFGMPVLDSYGNVYPSAYFKIENGILYSCFGNDSEIITVSHGELEQMKYHTVRVQTSKEFKELYFFLDGELIRTCDISNITSFYINGWGVYAKKVGGTLSTQYSQLNFTYATIANEVFD